MFGLFKKSKSPKTTTAQRQTRTLKVSLACPDETFLQRYASLVQKAFVQTPLVQIECTCILADENQTQNNFFDLWDTGLKILKQQKADVLILLFEEKNQIKIMFQKENMYEPEKKFFFSFVSTLFLPPAYFEENKFPKQIAEIITGAVLSLMVKQDKAFLTSLQQIVSQLEKEKMPTGLENLQIAYVLNMLAVVYLSAQETLSVPQGKTLLSIFKSAFNLAEKANEQTLLGCLYIGLSTLYETVAVNEKTETSVYFNHALETLLQAKRYFNKFVHPYDYGYLSGKIAELYFTLFAHVEDLTYLREGIFHLRQAEKIFTMLAHPYIWADIQGKIAHYLSILGQRTDNAEIKQLSIENYKNRQRVYTKENKPFMWANIEACIADTYYHLGKLTKDETFLEEAAECYTQALEVYEQEGAVSEANQMKDCLAKTEKLLKSADF